MNTVCLCVQMVGESSKGGQWVVDRDGEWWMRLREKIGVNTNINKVSLSLSLVTKYISITYYLAYTKVIFTNPLYYFSNSFP